MKQVKRASQPLNAEAAPLQRTGAVTRAAMFLTLSADGTASAEDQRSRTRKAFMVFAALLWLLAAPLYWTASARGAVEQPPPAVAVKAVEADEDEDEDDDDEGEATATSSVATTGTGAKDETTNDTTANNDPGTGRETRAANTDQAGLETGPSTRGETDAGDATGASEGNPTTGAETRAQNTDRRGLATGVSTRGETDPGDDTGLTERR